MRLATRLYFPDLIMPDVVNQLMNLMIGWIVVKEERIGTKSELVYDRNQVSVSGTETKL
jgi:hypothetical protein